MSNELTNRINLKSFFYCRCCSFSAWSYKTTSFIHSPVQWGTSKKVYLRTQLKWKFVFFERMPRTISLRVKNWKEKHFTSILFSVLFFLLWSFLNVFPLPVFIKPNRGKKTNYVYCFTAVFILFSIIVPWQKQFKVCARQNCSPNKLAYLWGIWKIWARIFVCNGNYCRNFLLTFQDYNRGLNILQFVYFKKKTKLSKFSFLQHPQIFAEFHFNFPAHQC